MQKQGTTWRYRAALAVLASCSLFAGAGADKKETPKPLPPEIVKAWLNAGAQVGWMKDVPPQAEGSYEYWAPWREKGEPGLCRRFGSTRKSRAC